MERFDAAYQGAPGAFSEEAALALAGAGARLLPCAEFADVFDAVRDGRARLGVVPVENTLAGPVRAAVALLASREVEVVGETTLRISHALVAREGASVASIRRVHSHPVALAQCRELLRRHPRLEAVEAYDTAGAVEEVLRSGSLEDAAIASERAAALYGGAVLARDVQDSPDNFTRFLAVERREPQMNADRRRSEK